jgi:hypothetical protein
MLNQALQIPSMFSEWLTKREKQVEFHGQRKLVLWGVEKGRIWRLKGREAVRLEPPIEIQNLVVCYLYRKIA